MIKSILIINCNSIELSYRQFINHNTPFILFGSYTMNVYKSYNNYNNSTMRIHNVAKESIIQLISSMSSSSCSLDCTGKPYC